MPRKDSDDGEASKGNGNLRGNSRTLSRTLPSAMEYNRDWRAFRRVFRLFNRPTVISICLREESHTEADIGVLVDFEDWLPENDPNDY